MRNLHYRSRSFRLSEKVQKRLDKMKEKEKSWNIVFEKLLEAKGGGNE